MRATGFSCVRKWPGADGPLYDCNGWKTHTSEPPRVDASALIDQSSEMTRVPLLPFAS